MSIISWFRDLLRTTDDFEDDVGTSLDNRITAEQAREKARKITRDAEQKLIERKSTLLTDTLTTIEFNSSIGLYGATVALPKDGDTEFHATIIRSLKQLGFDVERWQGSELISIRWS